MHENELARIVFFTSLEIHKSLGPGLLESSYEECLFYKLTQVNLCVEKQKPLLLIFENVRLEIGYRVDLLVENKLVIEVKSVDAINDVHIAQVLTYLKLSGCKLGLLINFNVALLKQGFRRIALNL